MTTFYNINELKILPDGSSVTVCGIITGTRRIPLVKDPTKFIVVGNIEDSTGEIEFVALHKILKKYNSLLEPEDKVIITGKYKKQEYSFIEVKTVMPYKEYFKRLYYENKNKKDK
ncbi:hypothetical protein IJG72_07925 [bacterium]|nr:hypothetical protein [bacterium]